MPNGFTHATARSKEAGRSVSRTRSGACLRKQVRVPSRLPWLGDKAARVEHVVVLPTPTIVENDTGSSRNRLVWALAVRQCSNFDTINMRAVTVDWKPLMARTASVLLLTPLNGF